MKSYLFTGWILVCTSVSSRSSTRVFFLREGTTVLECFCFLRGALDLEQAKRLKKQELVVFDFLLLLLGSDVAS